MNVITQSISEYETWTSGKVKNAGVRSHKIETEFIFKKENNV
jgi:hypothetical protein